MSVAYSRMVRSLLNQGIRATLWIAVVVHAAGSAHRRSTVAWAAT